MLYNYGELGCDFLERHFYFILVFYILEAFLILKQLFHSCLLDMR